jgi:hypothetical protein
LLIEPLAERVVGLLHLRLLLLGALVQHQQRVATADELVDHLVRECADVAGLVALVVEIQRSRLALLEGPLQ